MKQRYHRVTPHRLTPQQERAWENSFNVLHDAFETLGDDYKKLNLVFEYCLPMYPPRLNGVISSQHVIRVINQLLYWSLRIVVMLEKNMASLLDAIVTDYISTMISPKENVSGRS